MGTSPRGIVGLSLLALVTASCDEKPVTSVTGPPRIHFETSERDLGEVRVTPDGHEARFQVVNRGLSNLTLKSLGTSCTCAGVTATTSVIAPGDTGEIVVRVRPRGPEESAASVVVHSDDPEQPETVLRVAWKAVAALELVPPSLDFGPVRPGESIERTVRVVRRGPEGDGVLGSVTTSPPASLSGRLDGDALRVALIAGDEYGPGTGVVSVKADAGPIERLSLPVRWTVADSIEATPRRLFLGSGATDSELAGRLVLTAAEGTLEVAAAEVEGLPSATAEVKPLDESRVAVDVRCRLPESAGRHAGRLVVRCERPERRTIEVPVSAFVTGNEVAARGAGP